MLNVEKLLKLLETFATRWIHVFVRVMYVLLVKKEREEGRSKDECDGAKNDGDRQGDRERDRDHRDHRDYEDDHIV